MQDMIDVIELAGAVELILLFYHSILGSALMDVIDGLVI